MSYIEFAALPIKAAGLVAVAAMTFPEIVVPEHVPIVAFSGMMGGVIKWIFDKSKFWPAGLSTIIAGLLIATFLWPVAKPLTEGITGRLDMEPVSALMFGGFMVGLLGMSLIGLIFDIFNARKERVQNEHN